MKKRTIDICYVERFQNGDKEAFAAIYNHYRNSLFYFIVTYTKSESDAEDILQEVFIKVYKNIHTLKNIQSFHSWLFSVTYNMTINFMRSYRKSHQVDLDEENNIEVVEDTTIEAFDLNAYERMELKNSVNEEIENLSDALKEVAQLRYLEDFSILEIADILSVPEGTVKGRLSRVREKLQPALKENGVSPNTYFSFGGGILLYEAFVLSLQNTEVSEAVYANILAGIATTTNKVVGGLFLLRAGVATVLVGGSVVFYQEVTRVKDVDYIDAKISHVEGYVSEDVKVSVDLPLSFTYEDVKITSSTATIPYEVEGQNIIFYASDNGNYNIRVKEYQNTIKIKNIDKEKPVIQNITYQKDYIQFELQDTISGIDFESSYVEYQSNKFKLDTEGKVAGNFDGGQEIKVYIYDKAGNSVTYMLMIEPS